MKTYKTNIRINVLLALGLIGILASCKPQDFTVPDADQYNKVFMQSAAQSPVAVNVEMEDNWFNIPFGAGFGGVNLPQSDIQVKFKADPALVAAYNLANGTKYPIMPAGSYELSETSVTVKKGSSSSNSISLKVNPSKFTGIIAHLLPISIESVSNGTPINNSLKTTYYLVKGSYSVNPYPRINRATWSIADFSTDENESVTAGGRAIHAIDNKLTTFWASQWRAAKPRPPHHITIDMGGVEKLHGVYIYNRLDASGLPKSNGNPKELTIETSLDGINWTYLQAYSSVPNLVENELWLDVTQEARFFRIRVNQSHADFYGTHITEINAF